MALDFSQSPIVPATFLLDPVAIIVGHEIDVPTARGEGGRGPEQLAGPRHASRVLSLVAPARMRIHDEMRIAIGPCRGFGRDARHGAANMGDGDLAFGDGSVRTASRITLIAASERSTKSRLFQ